MVSAWVCEVGTSVNRWTISGSVAPDASISPAMNVAACARVTPFVGSPTPARTPRASPRATAQAIDEAWTLAG